MIHRWLIESLTATIGFVKRGRRVRRPPTDGQGRVKANLGCGLAVAPGWLNIDASMNALVASWPRFTHRVLYRLSGANRYYRIEQYCDLLERHSFVHHDLAHSIPLPDQSVDVVYSSHFVEHLFKADALRLLREAHRVLKPGGLIRIAVPDLAHAVSLYAKGEKHTMLENYFFVEDRSSYLARHKYMYDFELLREALERAGFAHIERRGYREGAVPDLEILDNRPEETLFVEARRIDAGTA